MLILGSLDGGETGIRNLIRSEPLQTTIYETPQGPVVLPTLAERVRLDEGETGVVAALAAMDRLYPQPNGESAVRQLAKQLAEPLPADLGDGDLLQYRMLDPRWSTWSAVAVACGRLAAEIEAHSLREAYAGGTRRRQAYDALKFNRTLATIGLASCVIFVALRQIISGPDGMQ